MVVFTNDSSKELITNTLMKKVQGGEINNNTELHKECVKLGADQEVYECVRSNLR